MTAAAVDTLCGTQKPRRVGTTRTSRYATTRQIAAAAGVHQTTVSLALRNHPRISEETKRRIRRLAAKLGYCRDPRLDELMHHLRVRRVQAYQETLAYISDDRTLPLWRGRKTFVQQLASLRERATALGFLLDEFWLGRDDLTAGRLDQILRSRGIRGLIIGPLLDELCVQGLRWENYTTVVLSYGLHRHAFHRVVSHHLLNIATALEELARRRFSRMGLVISRALDERILFSWTTAYHGFCARHPELQPVPVCFANDRATVLADEAAGLLSWFREHRPQIVLSNVPDWCNDLRRAGYDCPRDFGYVLLDRHGYPGFEDSAGIDQRHPHIGAIAIDQLAQYLSHGDLGVPRVPITTMVTGEFIDGATLPRLLVKRRRR